MNQNIKNINQSEDKNLI